MHEVMARPICTLDSEILLAYSRNMQSCLSNEHINSIAVLKTISITFKGAKLDKHIHWTTTLMLPEAKKLLENQQQMVVAGVRPVNRINNLFLVSYQLIFLLLFTHWHCFCNWNLELEMRMRSSRRSCITMMARTKTRNFCLLLSTTRLSNQL